MRKALGRGWMIGHRGYLHSELCAFILGHPQGYPAKHTRPGTPPQYRYLPPVLFNATLGKMFVNSGWAYVVVRSHVGPKNHVLPNVYTSPLVRIAMNITMFPRDVRRSMYSSRC